MASTTTTGVPTGTDPKNESTLLEDLRAISPRNLKTLADVGLSGLGGEPLNDKDYLMERIIQLTADLPLHHKFSDTLTNKFLSELWNDLSHPPQSYLGYDYVFRKADGSNNNIMWPHIGKAGQPYARSVRPQKMQPSRPDPGVVYDAVLARKKFEPHPNKISSVLFYVASIIIHDCFHTSHKDYAVSDTSSYLDLAPLYGSNEKDQLAVRTLKDGKLKPDCFSDSRIHGFPPGVGVMLIFFNRFHNNVVENLARIDEGGRFSDILNENRKRRTGLTPADPNGKTPIDVDSKTRTPEQLYDEALFQTGRLITTGLYINIVLQDYVRTILGLNRVDRLWNLDPRSDYDKGIMPDKIPQAGGNQVSAEFSLVYRWHSCVSERDEAWTTELLKKIGSKPDLITAAQEWADRLQKQAPEDRPLDTLKRLPDGRFSDDDLAKVWIDSVNDLAGAFGANHVPLNLKFVEILSMIQARSWNLASLNEFRVYFKLQPHETFESINPDPQVATALKKLYGHPDNVEIYPGIVVESAKKSMAPGSGLCASWTTSRAILSDAVALVRGDRFYTIDYTPNNLTNWGFQTAGYDLNINYGGVIYKLVLNALPNHISKNSVFAHFPLVIPSENMTLLTEMNRAQLYSDKPWSQAGVPAIFGASEAAKAKGDVKMTFAQAVMANEKWSAVTTKFYTDTLQRLWNEKQYELGGYQTIDVVADVLNPAHASFIKSVLNIPLDAKDEEHHGLFACFGHVFDTAYSVDAQPQGVSSAVRDLTHWFVGGIASLFKGSNSASKEGQLGQEAIKRLAAANGPNAEKLTWQDILPTSALLLTTLSRSTAGAVEAAIAQEQGSSVEPPTMTVRAPADAGDVQKGQAIKVDLCGGHKDDDVDKHGPELELAHKVAKIANDTIEKILEAAKGVKRVPGLQGKIKKVSFDGGDVRYLNLVESEYVPYPVSLKVRWKA